MVSFDAPAGIQCSTSIRLLFRASPKTISGRTSYLRVRLEFLRYPQLIATLFNGCAFGPPPPLTAASTWPWVGHPVSGLCHATNFALFRLGFPTAPQFLCLTLPHHITRRTVLQKVHGCRPKTTSVACRRKVSGSLSLPSRGPFHLSFTVLVLYRSLSSI